ncbi:UNVERIFIED_CONTAM: hypothetical protein NCL1_52482 [Trichonephila clavipes]
MTKSTLLTATFFTGGKVETSVGLETTGGLEATGGLETTVGLESTGSKSFKGDSETVDCSMGDNES